MTSRLTLAAALMAVLVGCNRPAPPNAPPSGSTASRVEAVILGTDVAWRLNPPDLFSGKPFQITFLSPAQGPPPLEKRVASTSWMLQLPIFIDGKPLEVDPTSVKGAIADPAIRFTAKSTSGDTVVMDAVGDKRLLRLTVRVESSSNRQVMIGSDSRAGSASQPAEFAYIVDQGRMRPAPPASAAVTTPLSGIEIDGPAEDQAAIDSWLFYLRRGFGQLGPFGVTNEQYNGHVFWDADAWIFPGLVWFEPDIAQRISQYRAAMRPSYQRNFQAAYSRSGGLIVPWESSISGQETSPADSRREIHITGTAAFFLQMAEDLLPADFKAGEFGREAAEFYRARAVPGRDGQLELRDVMSPDENHVGKNDLYTNLVAQWTIDRYRPDWKVRFALPKDQTSYLTYDNDPIRSYKQAAAVLAIYPLQVPAVEAQAKTMMERFSGKVSRNGPAMTDSIHALIWARLGDVDRAYETWQRSWKEFSFGGDLRLFSEKRHRPITYFMTGAGGCLQTVIYGFCGFRVDPSRNPSAKWSLPLKNGRWLNVTPHLPKAWKAVRLKNISVLGKRYNITVSADSVSASEGEK